MSTPETPEEQQPPSPDKKPAAPGWAVAIVAVVLLVACGGGIAAVVGGDDPDPVADDNSIAAEIMCERFIEDRLRAPASAEYPDPTTTKDGAEYTVAGAVDSENGMFGAMVRSTYTCQVRDNGDDSWSLIDLQISD